MQLELHKDITVYLSTMKKMLNTGAKFVVVSETKDKNLFFMYLYQITKEDVKKQLLSLKENEFKEKTYSTNEDHFGEELYVWNPVRTFINQDGEEVEEKMYIKTHIDEMKKLVVVISFHRYGDI